MSRVGLTCRVGVAFAVMLMALLSACSDSNSRTTTVEEISEKTFTQENDGPALSFVGGSVMFTEVDPINIVYEDHEGDNEIGRAHV